MSDDVCAARIETLHGWSDAGVDGRVEHGVVRRIAGVEAAWDACLAACEFRDVQGNPGPDLRATMDQFRTNEAWVRGIATTLEDAPIVDGVSELPAGEVATAIDGGVDAPNAGLVEYDALEVTGLPVTSGLVNDPVNAANGNFVHADRDIATPGFGAVLDVVRTYNSLASLQTARPGGSFGAGWTSMLDVALDVASAEAGVVRLTFTDGAIVTFRADAEAEGGAEDGTRSWGPNGRRSLTLDEHAPDTAGGVGNRVAWTVTRDHGRRRFHFAADGLLVGGSELAAVYSVDRAGSSVTLTEEQSGRWVRYVRDDRGLVVEVVSSDGRSCRYSYDGAGRCVGVERSIGDLVYTYDDAGFLVSSVDADGVADFVNTYDLAGRVVGQVAPHGRRTRFDYLDNGGTRITEDDVAPGVGVGASNLLFHDRSGNLTAMYGSDGGAMRAFYDDHGRLVRHVDRAGAVTTYDYADDAAGGWSEGGSVGGANHDLIARRTDPDGLFEDRDYDHAGRLVHQRDRSGAQYWFTYEDDNPHPVQVSGPEGVGVVTAYDDRWLPVAVTDADGVTTTFEWNADGHLAASVNGAGERTVITHDETGQLTGVVEPSGARTTFELDNARRVAASVGADGVAQRFAYSAAGRVLSMATPAPGSWTATHGDHGDVVSVTDGVGATVGFTHDTAGRIVAMTAPDGTITTQAWDGLGQLLSVTDAAGGVTTQTYDLAGRSVSVTKPDGRTHQREVDVLGRTVALVEPDGATWHRTYHPNGQVASVTDPAGAVYEFELDAVGRVVAEIGPDGGRCTYTYSPASRLLTETTPAGRTITTSYDAAGRVVATTDSDGVTATAEPVSGNADVSWGIDSLSVARGGDNPATFSLDPRQLLAEVHDPGGVSTRLERDIRGRLTGTTTGPSTTTVDYDPTGAVARTVDASGAATSYRTSASGQVEAILFGAAEGNDSTVGGGLGITFDRDDAGRPTTVAALDGTPLSAYSYDPCGRLLAASAPHDASPDAVWRAITLERDERGFVTAVSGADGDIRYERDADGLVIAMVDPAGNRTALRRSSAGRLQGFADTSAGEVPLPPEASSAGERDDAGRVTVDRHGRRYDYDLAGRLATSISPSGASWAFTYNDLGLLATDTHTPSPFGPDGEKDMGSDGGSVDRRTFTYDVGGRLVAVTGADGGVTQFRYDVAGRRIGREGPDGSAVVYVWDEVDRLLSLTTTSADGSVRTRRFTHNGLGQVAAVDDVTIGWDPVIANKPVAIGAQRYLRAGMAVCPAEPDAHWFDGTFDDPYGTGAGDGVRLGYRGELTVDGLVFMGDRVYDPATRSFLSKDPLPPRPGTNGSFASPYLYAWSDPVNYVDPSGREPVSIEEFEAWRTRQENNRFERAGQAIVDDPWGSLAMATVVVGGAVLLATPFAPIGAGILIGAASATAMGLATDNFNPRTVAISGAFGAVPGGTSVRTAFAVGVGENVATQVLVDGRGLGEINIGEALFSGTFNAAIPFLTSRGGTSNVVPNGPASDLVSSPPSGAIGFTDDAVGSAFQGMRGGGGHATRHLVDEGLIPNSGSLASRVELFEDLTTPLLTNPTSAFDWRLGNTVTRAFAGDVSGTPVVAFVAKDGAYQGVVVSAVVPDADQLVQWGL